MPIKEAKKGKIETGCRRQRIPQKHCSFYFFAVLGFELRAYTLSQSTSCFFVKSFYKIGSCQLYLHGLASNLNPPDLCLLSSLDYRHNKPPAPR
jgi:hypothetical protein